MQKIIKKTIAIVIAFAVIFSINLAEGSVTLAAAMPVFSVDDIETSGEDISLNVSLQNNIGLSAFLIKIKYDTSAFQFVSCERGDFSSQGSMEISQNSRGCDVAWFISNGEVTANGTVCVLHLKKNEGTSAGVYPVTITCDERNTINSQEDIVPVRCENGSITVWDFTPTVLGYSDSCRAGQTIEYSVVLEDNPGIAAYLINLEFDTSVLSFVEDSLVTTFGGNINYRKTENGLAVQWYQNSNSTADGELFHFNLAVNRTVSGTFPITILIDDENTITIEDGLEKSVELNVQSGEITVSRNLAVYDVNSDGTVDDNDMTLVARYIAKLVDLPEAARIKADVDGNGQIDSRDVTLIARVIGE